MATVLNEYMLMMMMMMLVMMMMMMMMMMMVAGMQRMAIGRCRVTV